jgi:hypothetical protein
MWNIVFGAVTGLLGTALTSWTNFKTQKLKNLHDIDKWKHEDKKIELETKAMIAEVNMQMKMVKTQVEGAVELADTKAYMEGIKQGNKNTFSDKWMDKLLATTGWTRYIAIPVGVLIAFLFGIVDFLKALIRPGITMYLTGVTTWITWMAWEIMQKANISAMTAIEASAIFNEVTSVVIYLTVSCVTWHFGDRRVAKFLMRLKDGNIKK